MRFPNFLSTVSNRASLSITQTLYDRRALDCTSSKPLVQSLQRLMILTSSSSRVRETLCQDGGIERLVQIMKETHHPEDALSSYKWHLCMQCLLNLGARGSETVRMRVLEAGAIPIIATVLDNYLVAHGDSLEHRDRDREGRHRRARNNAASVACRTHSSSTTAPSLVTSSATVASANTSTQPPDPFPPAPTDSEELRDANAEEPNGDGGESSASSSGPEESEPRMAAQAEHFLNQFSQATGRAVHSRRSQHANEDVGNAPPIASAVDETGAVPPRTLPASQEAISVIINGNRGSAAPTPSGEVEQGEMAQFINGLLIPREQDVFWALEIIAFVSKYSHLRREMQETHFLPQLSLRPHEELFAGISCADMTTSGEDEMDDDSYDNTDNSDHDHDHHYHDHDHRDFDNNNSNEDHFMLYHREEEENQYMTDDFMSVDDPAEQRQASPQQDSSSEQTHAHMHAQKSGKPQTPQPIFDEVERAYYSYDFENNVDFDDEYLTRPVNLFELVERFTAFRSPREFPHWACIIMRNFVRKDEGGIRQCANFACGKWEEYPRQFAKCRRCKRTKYCSKACQLKAWSMHRYWCAPSTSSSQPSSQQSLPQHAPASQQQIQQQVQMLHAHQAQQTQQAQQGQHANLAQQAQQQPSFRASNQLQPQSQSPLPSQSQLLDRSHPSQSAQSREQQQPPQHSVPQLPQLPQQAQQLQRQQNMHQQETFVFQGPLQSNSNTDSDLESRVDSPQSGSVTFAN